MEQLAYYTKFPEEVALYSTYYSSRWSRLSEIGSLTLHATIFQLYLWRHIDMQADWRSWTNGRAPNAIDISLALCFLSMSYKRQTQDPLPSFNDKMSLNYYTPIPDGITLF